MTNATCWHSLASSRERPTSAGGLWGAGPSVGAASNCLRQMLNWQSQKRGQTKEGARKGAGAETWLGKHIEALPGEAARARTNGGPGGGAPPGAVSNCVSQIRKW